MKLVRILGVVTCVLLSGAARGQEQQPKDAHFIVPKADVGTVVPLMGKWMFEPGPGPSAGKAVPVPVPQMLSRIQWWLDDSEEFKKWEQARLDALGFDTDKTDEGTYRVTFDIPKEWSADKHLWAEFDGVAMKCKVACNGQPVGEHVGMFSRFAFDLTPHLKPGTNELSVWASMEKIPPTSGNLGQAVTVNLSAAKVISLSKGMFGPLTPNQDNRAYDLLGIWQPVKLVVRGAAKIDAVWFQPTPDGGAKIHVEATSHGAEGDVKVGVKFAELADAKAGGNTYAVNAEHNESLARAEPLKKTYDAGFKGKRWTPAEPNLYRLDVTLTGADGTVLDRWSHDVGFRTFEVKGNQLLLNGKPYWLRGANQLPYGKNPWDPTLARKLIGLMHDGNQRFTRTHCTPWNEPWLAAADEIGLAVSIEGIRPWAFAGRSDQIGHEVMPPKEIVDHWLMENADVVKRCRNHPSVVMFTVGNEMLLRDGQNMKKWQILSDVTKQTRDLAGGLPVVCSSDYVRDEKFYEGKLKPAGMDDGDVDDMHKYAGWYSSSPFLTARVYDKELAENARKRPLIGQEMSSGYPDLDTGLPVLRYTRDLLTPQAWVGVYAYPGNDPAIYLAEHAKVTKRWAEMLRHQRARDTAGFALFSAECWYRRSFDPAVAEPYPVYEAVKQAYAPVGLALETNQRRFYAGDTVMTKVWVTNDDEHFRDLADLTLTAEFIPAGSETARDARAVGKLAKLAYYETASVSARIVLPGTATKRQPGRLVLRLTSDGKEVGRTEDAIEIFPTPEAPLPAPAENVVIVRRGESLADLTPGKPLYEKVSAGATAILFSPSADIVKQFPNDLLDVRNGSAEFADWYPVRGTKLADGLAPMDLKWWARRDDKRAFVAPTSHRLKPGGKARELLRYIPAHSYIAAEKVPEQYRVIMSEIPVGKGRLWLCDLDLEACAQVDPAAAAFARNLYRAAADPESTRTLPGVPSHEELLKGATRTADAR